MRITQTTILDMLIKHRGNQSEVARVLNVNRTTVRKYARDLSGEHHIVRLHWSHNNERLTLGVTMDDIQSFDHAQLLVSTCGRKDN